jgi:hypothetical protein
MLLILTFRYHYVTPSDAKNITRREWIGPLPSMRDLTTLIIHAANPAAFHLTKIFYGVNHLNLSFPA